MKQLNWGIVSTGRIAEQFVSDMPLVNNGKVLAVAARKKSDAQAFADMHDIERAYGRYDDLFADKDIDVVYIATPHTLHFQHAHAAIMAGKHVLCEKPFTVSSEQCRQLTTLAKTRGVYIMEAMWTYFLPAIVKAKEWVEQGRIGNIKHVKADFGYPIPYDPNLREYDKKLAGGCLLEMGIYPIAIAAYFLNRDIDYWHVNGHIAPNGVEDDVIMLAELGDAKATLATSFQCKLNNFAYIIGDKGYIAIHDFWRANSCSLFVLDEEVEKFEDGRESFGFNYEAQTVGEDILSGKLESEVVTHARSLWLQTQMERVKGFIL
ncbi:Gfo/Idh/MocA family protein [Thalassotalea euphylliae]|uniref:Gfo/Idh/MocA family protein n=1 Tax=Thalassotalea euphylliae TaxID=1655234 RepID=UPI00364380EA